MITYESHIKPFSSSFNLVEIDLQTLNQIDQFVQELVAKKKNEKQHLFDNRSHYKRYYTGTLGEIALEKFLNITGIVDWTIGDSKEYHQPDLKKLGVNAGVKTVEYGSFPVIFKKSYSSEIIMIKWEERHVYICGVATKKILNQYQSTDLIKDKALKQRGTKTGFYGFEHLQQFNNLEELIKITSQ